MKPSLVLYRSPFCRASGTFAADGIYQPFVHRSDANAVDMGLRVNELPANWLPRVVGQPALLKRAGEILFGLLRYLISHPRTRRSGC